MTLRNRIIAIAAGVALVFAAGWWTGHSNVIRTTTETSHTASQTTQAASSQQQATSQVTDHSTSSTATSTTQAAKVTRTHTKVTKKDGTVIERDREVVDNSTYNASRVDAKADTTSTATTTTATQATTITTTTTDTKKVTVEKPAGDHVSISLYVEQDVMKALKDKRFEVRTNLDVDVKVWGPLFVGGTVSDVMSKDRSYIARAGIQVSF